MYVPGGDNPTILTLLCLFRIPGVFPGVSFTICPKADALYPIVSAASIVAKVTRDHHMTQYEKAFNSVAAAGGAASVKLGSGYPGDPDTKAWIGSNVNPLFGLPKVARFSWETCNRLLQEEAVHMSWECEDPNAGQPTLSAFAAADKFNEGAESNGSGRHSYFRVRKMQPMPVMF